MRGRMENRSMARERGVRKGNKGKNRWLIGDAREACKCVKECEEIKDKSAVKCC